MVIVRVYSTNACTASLRGVFDGNGIIRAFRATKSALNMPIMYGEER